jgi:hypothetical protein
MPSKQERSVFLYLDPAAPRADEQCGTCEFWVKSNKCMLHRVRDKVTASMSCCYYLYGMPRAEGTTPWSLTRPEESGLVDRPVRCENCRWGGPDTYKCGLFTLLNKKLPDVFDLDVEIDPRGCCNAQEPRTPDQQREERLEEAEI